MTCLESAPPVQPDVRILPAQLLSQRGVELHGSSILSASRSRRGGASGPLPFVSGREEDEGGSSLTRDLATARMNPARDGTRSHVRGPHDGTDGGAPSRRDAVVEAPTRGLGRVTLPPLGSQHVVADLELALAFHVLVREAAVAHEATRVLELEGPTARIPYDS